MQRAPSRGPHSFELVEQRGEAPRLAPLPVEADGEAVRLVPNTLQELQTRIVT